MSPSLRCRIVWIVCVALSTAASAHADSEVAGKRPLTHDDYDSWQSIRGQQISRDGQWVAYAVTPQRGDAELRVRATVGDQLYRYVRGERPRFTADGRYVVFRIAPAHADELAYQLARLTKGSGAAANATSGSPAAGPRGRRGGRRGRRSGAGRRRGASGSNEADSNRPVAGLGILRLSDGFVEVIDRVKSFDVLDEGPAFVIYQLEKPRSTPRKRGEDEQAVATERASGQEPQAEHGVAERTAGESPPESAGRASAKQATLQEPGEAPAKRDQRARRNAKYLRDGTPLIVRDLDSGEVTRLEGVVRYGVTKKRGFLYYACSSKKDVDGIERGLFARELASGRRFVLTDGAADFTAFAFDHDVTRMAWVSDRRDRDADKPTYDLYGWDFSAAGATRLASHIETPAFPIGQCVSKSARLRFCRDGSALLFGIGPIPRADLPKILLDEKVTLDLWHYRDGRLQPMQARQARRESTTACLWDFASGRMQVVARKESDDVDFLATDGSTLLLRDGEPYAARLSWDGRYEDISVVERKGGAAPEVRLLVAENRGRAQASPDGRYLLVFEGGNWHAIDIVSGTHRDLTSRLGVSFAREDDDTPAPAGPYGIAGWLEGEESVLVYDRHDIWALHPDGTGAHCLTDGVGRRRGLRLRYERVDSEARHIPKSGSILLSAFDLETMASGYFSDAVDRVVEPDELVLRDVSFGSLRRAKGVDRFIFKQTTFSQCGDLWTADASFGELSRLSAINPQQQHIRWGTAELVHWRSADGVPLKGILIKPEGFDPTRKYPMMVSFYERMSTRLHRYIAPTATTSPNAAYYVSNGYLWFMPDIVYREGYPGDSCVKCVVSGVQMLIERGFVDERVIGAAGHSWGGYQTAYLVTRTDIFAAVESGAPVSNMTSAYGGIRWSTGMSRAFQYEKTQSRIGGTLWTRPMRYFENSPIFYADRVNTPVLILHNDEDGAVPWYQGIEYFCALRRLDKEVYLFDYVGEGHGLSRRANRLDWTMRMQQYFDHHLRGREAPDWMRHGVAHADRDREKLEFNPPASLQETQTTPAKASSEIF